MIFSIKNQNNYQQSSNQKNKDILMQFSNRILQKPREIKRIEIPIIPPTIKEITEENNKLKKMKWGEPTWFLFHTLAEKVKEDHFNLIRKEFLDIIFTICSNLPCPICTKHAISHLRGINFNSIQTKQQLKDLLFQFHNIVNQKKNFSLFDYSQLDQKYSKANTNLIITNFIHFYGDKNKNMKLIADDFIRTKIVQKLSEWFYININHFNM